MRKVDAAARPAAPAASGRNRASRELVCLALILAVAVLLFRIASTF